MSIKQISFQFSFTIYNTYTTLALHNILYVSDYRFAELQRKKLHCALRSLLCPAARGQAQNCRFIFGPFFLTVRKTHASLCPLQTGGGAGPNITFKKICY